jgi:TrmH family RNA methyltransferase
MLSNIRIVLVNTSHPGNIGAVARAMKNMCLEDLALVQPQQFPHADATARASGADDVLARARVYDALDPALADCRLVFGASARPRSIAWPQVTPRQCADEASIAAASGNVAIVFGREHSGLTNDELDRCHKLVTIPCNPDYSSLNIAAAVQVITYELLLAAGNIEAPQSIEDRRLVTGAEREGFFNHLEATLEQLEFIGKSNPRLVMRRLRRLYNRVEMDENELNILRGILTATQAKLRGGRQPD